MPLHALDAARVPGVSPATPRKPLQAGLARAAQGPAPGPPGGTVLPGAPSPAPWRAGGAGAEEGR